MRLIIRWREHKMRDTALMCGLKCSSWKKSSTNSLMCYFKKIRTVCFRSAATQSCYYYRVKWSKVSYWKHTSICLITGFEPYHFGRGSSTLTTKQQDSYLQSVIEKSLSLFVFYSVFSETFVKYSVIFVCNTFDILL